MTSDGTGGPEGGLIRRDNELLDVHDLCNYLKMSRATVQRWCRTGYLPAAKVGKEYRVRRGDLENWYQRRLLGQRA